MEEVSILVDRKSLFEIITELLSKKEKQNFSCLKSETLESWHDGRDFCSSWGMNKNSVYTIFSEDQKPLFQHKMVEEVFAMNEIGVVRNYMEKKEESTVSLREMALSFSTIYDQFPYLQTFFEMLFENFSSFSNKISKEKLAMTMTKVIKQVEKIKQKRYLPMI